MAQIASVAPSYAEKLTTLKELRAGVGGQLPADQEEGLLDRLPGAGQVHGDEVAVP